MTTVMSDARLPDGQAVGTCKATQVRYKGDFSILAGLLMSK